MTASVSPAQIPLDLSSFSSREDAIAKASVHVRSYERVILPVIKSRPVVTLLDLFAHTCVTRARALHEAVIREIGKTNPPAVFTLLRAWTELVATLLYVKDHPRYVLALIGRGAELGEGVRRKTMQKLIAHGSARMPGLKTVYSELCEEAHFGSLAFWASFTADDGEPGRISWASYPRWRNSRDPLLACAWVIELSRATRHLLSEFADAHLVAQNPDSIETVDPPGGAQ